MNRNALVISIVLFSLAVASAQAPERPGTVMVNATGTVYGAPDRASFDAGVSVLDEDVAGATARAGERVARLLAALTAAGVAEADLRTVGLSIFPEQLYGPNGEPTRLRYRVVNTVRVTVRDAGQLGSLLGASVAAGANEVSSVVYTLADRSALEEQALARAMRSARDKARQLARLGGGSLGPPLRIVEGTLGGGSMGDVRLESIAASTADATSVPVAGGQLEVTVSLRVTYGLE